MVRVTIGTDPEADRGLAEEWAPIVVLHEHDSWAPMSPIDFIDASRLIWRRNHTDYTTLAEPGTIEASSLGLSAGDNAYASPEREVECRCNDLTRPFDRRTSLRPPGLSHSRGFALLPTRDLGILESGESLHTAAQQAPVYYEVRREMGATLICYWLFFGTSTPPLDFKSAHARRPFASLWARLRSRGLPDTQTTADVRRGWEVLFGSKVAHQGDWEGVTVQLENGELTSVHFRAHHGADPPTPAALCDFGDDQRLRVYNACGSHASYPNADARSAKKEGDRLSTAGVLWDTRADIQSARLQPWYGFGGAWGNPDLDRHRYARVSMPDMSGPLGPGPHKPIWPASG